MADRYDDRGRDWERESDRTEPRVREWGRRGGGRGGATDRGPEGDWGRDRPWNEGRFGRPDWGRQGWGRDRWASPGEGSQGAYGGRAGFGREGPWGEGRAGRDWERGGGRPWDRGSVRAGRGLYAGGSAGVALYVADAEAYSSGAGAPAGRGRYTGLGPRGWRRSDERIREDVNERLTDHPDIDATDIEVRVEAGEVTLAGALESRVIKRLAEDVAESVSGVRDVRNELRVHPRAEAGTARPEGT